MRLTIDTKTDSKDEIRKAIKLLLGLVGSHEVYTNEPEKPASQPNIFESPTPAVGNLMSIFDSAPAPEAPKEEEKKDDVPELEFY
ncbi:Uncharacterised protein [uncultured archaeon]|nr:Uncharacterised protein [uncultured archaeon]